MSRMRAAPRRTRRIRMGAALVRDVLFLVPRHPRVAVRIARLTASGSTDPADLPLLERALAVRRTPTLLRRYATLLGTAGQLTTAAATWRELADRGDREAVRRLRITEGRLIETDTSWLPTLAGPAERLQPLSPRRILHIAKSSAPERWSGFTIRTMHNLHAQQAVGLEPLMLTELGWPRAVGVAEVSPQVMVEGVPHYRLDRGPGYDPASLPNDQRTQDNAGAMAPIVRELRPAILHAHSGYRGGEHALVALALRERFGIPVVYEVRGLFESVWSPNPDSVAGSEQYARRLAQETRILHDVDGVLAISEALADEMVERGVPRAKITLVPNGIDPDVLVAQPRDDALRASLGMEDRFVVGYLGNLDHWREGIDVLIAAVAILHQRGRQEVALLVVGDGSRRPALEAEARRMRLGPACRFTGRVPHESVAQYYAQMDLFANPRVEERAARLITPLKPYEAMAMGRPVLVSDLPALREIVAPPERGIVARPGDADGLAAAIEAAMDDDALRARIAEAGQTWVRSERIWAANGARYRAAYEAILGPIG